MANRATGRDRVRGLGGGFKAFPFVPRDRDEDAPVEAPRTGGLRIAYLQPCSHLGGSERQAAAVIGRLPAHDIDVVPVVGPSPMLCRWLEQHGVRGSILLRSFPTGHREDGEAWHSSVRGYLRRVRQTAEQVEALVRDGGIELVVAGSPFAWLAATRVARKLGVPIVWRADGTRLEPLPAAALRIWAALARPDLVLFDGEASRAASAVNGDVPTAAVLPGVDLDLFRPGRGEARGLRPPGAATVVGFAGRLAPHARPEDFVKMAAIVAARRSDVCFLMAGEGPSRERCEELSRKLGLERCLRFLGFVTNMPTFYGACDVVVHPSTAAATSSVLLEAMALERAVVAADVPATTDVMAPGREGLVCAPGQPGALADTVANLLDVPMLRQALGRAALERVRRQFDARVAADRLSVALHRAAGRSPPVAAPLPALNAS
jgi:glycosyltransferase involved in cell wall biosynthesis